MGMTTSNYPDLSLLEDIVKTAAKEELLPRFTRVAHSIKNDGSLITEADLAMQQRVQAELQKQWPQYAFLGEEMEEQEQQRMLTAAEGVWCLDPLDGTSNFATGLPFFSVSLALLVNGEVVMGIVYDPTRDECFSAQKGQGAWLNGEVLGQHRPSTPLHKGIGLVDFKRLSPELATRLAVEPPYSSQRSLGSVALDWCWLAAGRFHVYLHGKQKIWDYAAGYLVFSELKGQATTLQGESLFQANLQPRSAVAALDATIFDEWVAWLGIHR